jgi:hypothetical protein
MSHKKCPERKFVGKDDDDDEALLDKELEK